MTIIAATTMAAMTLVAVPPPHPSRSKIVAVASTAMIDKKVSQPIETSHEMTPGTFCPVTPKAARDKIIVGAEPRLPAIAMIPQSTKETTTPSEGDEDACQKEMPKPRTNAAYEIPKTETLAANHGQKRSFGDAVRSDSSMISMPVVSTPSFAHRRRVHP
jgi:hypothetical protein